MTTVSVAPAVAAMTISVAPAVVAMTVLAATGEPAVAWALIFSPVLAEARWNEAL